MDTSNFHPGRITFTDQANSRIPQPQRIEILLNGAWVHFRELDATGDVEVQSVPASSVEQIIWTWPTGRP